MNWHQNVFFADQAIILPFVLLVFLEVIKGNLQNRMLLLIVAGLQALLIFFGVLTDPLFVFVTLVIWCVRVFAKEMGNNLITFIKKSLVFWFPAVLAVLLFLFQLHSFGILSQLLAKLLYRTGLDTTGADSINNFMDQFWMTHVQTGFGIISVYLLWGSLVILFYGFFVLIWKKYCESSNITEFKSTLSFITYLIIPCFLQIYFFRNHCIVHDFSALKLSVPLAVVPFILVPILLYQSMSDNMRHFFAHDSFGINVLICSFILLFIAWQVPNVQNYKTFFPSPNPHYRVLGDFLQGSTGYQDVVFSTQVEVPMVPPQKLSYTEKRVYKIKSLDEIYEKVKEIKQNFNVGILMNKGTNLRDAFQALEPFVFHTKTSSGYTLVKIHGEEFMVKYQDGHFKSN